MENQEKDKTQRLLESMLNELHKAQAEEIHPTGNSYLIASDGQYLGKIIDNKFDSESILNEYGTFGSKYSSTSIFNEYSQYGGQYGIYSLNNPYSSSPPKLYINGKLLGEVSSNEFLFNRIPAESFLYALKNDIKSLLHGEIPKSEIEIRKQKKESFIVAKDGAYLGSLVPNNFDGNSIFNQFGPFGSQFSSSSIFNQYGQYGSQFSSLSPYNQMSYDPPEVYLKGKLVGYLTKNSLVSGNKINPDNIKEWAKENLSRYSS